MKTPKLFIEKPITGGYIVTDDSGHMYIRKSTLREISAELIRLNIEFPNGINYKSI